MKRLLIFGLLGPPLGFVVGIFVLLPLFSLVLGDESHFDWHQITLLPLAYYLGIVPALLAGAVDAALANRTIRRRAVWTALAAFMLSFIPFATAFAMGFIHGAPILLYGLVGAVPGYLCSLLAR